MLVANDFDKTFVASKIDELLRVAKERKILEKCPSTQHTTIFSSFLIATHFKEPILQMKFLALFFMLVSGN